MFFLSDQSYIKTRKALSNMHKVKPILNTVIRFSVDNHENAHQVAHGMLNNCAYPFYPQPSIPHPPIPLPGSPLDLRPTYTANNQKYLSATPP